LQSTISTVAAIANWYFFSSNFKFNV